MKEVMELQNKSGYVLNKESGQLEKYEFISCLFNFATNEAKYECKLGGNKMFLTNNDMKVYKNESDYKYGSFLNPYNIDFNIAVQNAYGFRPIWINEAPHAWEYQNGDAVLVDISDTTFICSGEYKISNNGDRQLYATRHQVFDYNDFIVKEESGEIRVVKSPASKLQFSDEQKELIKELQNLLKKINDAKMELLFDENIEKLYAVNTANIQEFVCWDDYSESKSYIQIQDMLYDMKSARVFGYDSGCSGVYAKFNEKCNE